jgi:hypothetical protein
MVRSTWSAIAVMALGASAIPAAMPAAGQQLAARRASAAGLLSRLEGGQWELRVHDAPVIERICLQDGQGLIQLRHPRDRCERIVVNDEPDETTVQYTCPGRGFGHTYIRRESERSVQIETQGIAQGLPFHFVAGARRVGDCGS